VAKNASYKNVYKITISGRNTNGFTAKIIDKFIRTVVMSVEHSWKQSKAAIEVMETKGDYNAEKQEYKENK